MLHRLHANNPLAFLCSADCVAERVRFEPSVPFVWSTKRRPVRNIQPILQHTRLLQRIASARKSGRAVPFRVPPKGERLAIVGLKAPSFVAPSAPQIG
jgi:hypothetical protein